jgi:mono/diheme cytochrome c family protein
VATKRLPLLIAAGILIVGLVVVFSVAMLHDGVSARSTPSHLEAILASNARRLAIPSDAKSSKNPLTPTVENLREARLHFADHCAICHANDGSGQAEIGRGLYPKPPDLRRAGTQNLSDGELFWTIENGIRFTGMPAFATHGAEGSSWQLVLFIRHLPQLSPQELTEMDRYNPKGPDDRKEEKQENEFLNQTAPSKKTDPKKADPEHKKH